MSWVLLGWRIVTLSLWHFYNYWHLDNNCCCFFCSRFTATGCICCKQQPHICWASPPRDGAAALWSLQCPQLLLYPLKCFQMLSFQPFQKLNVVLINTCLVINDNLLRDVLLPGLHCLHRDVQEVAQDHVVVLESMIREFQEKTDSGRSSEK